MLCTPAPGLILLCPTWGHTAGWSAVGQAASLRGQGQKMSLWVGPVPGQLWGFCVNCAPDGAIPVPQLVQEPPITYRSGMRALGESWIGLRGVYLRG